MSRVEDTQRLIRRQCVDELTRILSDRLEVLQGASSLQGRRCIMDLCWCTKVSLEVATETSSFVHSLLNHRVFGSSGQLRALDEELRIRRCSERQQLGQKPWNRAQWLKVGREALDCYAETPDRGGQAAVCRSHRSGSAGSCLPWSGEQGSLAALQWRLVGIRSRAARAPLWDSEAASLAGPLDDLKALEGDVAWASRAVVEAARRLDREARHEERRRADHGESAAARSAAHARQAGVPCGEATAAVERAALAVDRRPAPMPLHAPRHCTEKWRPPPAETNCCTGTKQPRPNFRVSSRSSIAGSSSASGCSSREARRGSEGRTPTPPSPPPTYSAHPDRHPATSPLVMSRA